MPARLIGIILLVAGILQACTPKTPYPRDIEHRIDRTIDERDRYEAV